MNKTGSSASKGIFASIQEEGKNLKTKEGNNINSKEVKNSIDEELSVKRSYTLRPSTVKKLQEMKVFMYDESTQYNEIVDEAIRLLYEKKKQD